MFYTMSERTKKIWRTIKPILVFAVLIWWGAMILFLIKRNKAPDPIIIPDINIVEIGEMLSEDYYSITFCGEKIGFSNLIVRRLLTGGLMYQESSFYRLPVGGVEHEITSLSLLAVDDSLRTRIVNFEFKADNYETIVNAVVSDGTLSVSVESGGDAFSRKYPLENPIYSTAVLPKLLANRYFTPSQSELNTFDPLTMSEAKYDIYILGEDRLDRFGSQAVYVVRITYGQISSHLFIEPSGKLLMETTQEGFMSVLEEKEIALSLDVREGGSNDLLEEFAIPLGMGVIKRPRDAVKLVLNIVDLVPGIFELDDFNQRWDENNGILTIISEGLDSVDEIYGPDSSDTTETQTIQCNDRRIINAALKITKDAETDLDKLVAINGYLFEEMKKDYTLSIPSAVEVLKKMRGDCNEHSILFVALARSIGIPARINVGLLYLNGDFYYHAWPQAFANGRWFTFDPTLGQFPADASHVKLTSGGLDEYLALLRMGNARLRLVSVTYSDGETYKTGETGENFGEEDDAK